MSGEVDRLFDPGVERWYAVHTRSRFEKKVEQAIRRRSFECFLPLRQVWSRRRDRRLKIEVPSFPGYLFVRATLMSSQYYDLITTPGLVGLVGAGGRPIPVSDEEILSLRLLAETKALVSPSGFVKGQKIEVVSGPFSGARGIVRRLRGGGKRLVVGVEVLRRAVAVELDDFAVEPIRG